jgi:hypothetical protein
MSLLESAAIKVSSVLNKDTKQYGKQFLTDHSLETCWNSAQKSPQFIHIEFPQTVTTKQVELMFQGGFAGKDCEFWIQNSHSDELSKYADFYPEDNNRKQQFPLEAEVRTLRIVFRTSTDFYGRITVYHLDII